MTNGEKYKTVEERTGAFKEHCSSHTFCGSCRFKNANALYACVFLWLDANDTPSIADIIETMRKRKEEEEWYSYEEWKALCDSLDAAAKRAYEKISNAMLSNNSDYIRKAMDETIGVLSYHRREK